MYIRKNLFKKYSLYVCDRSSNILCTYLSVVHKISNYLTN